MHSKLKLPDTHDKCGTAYENSSGDIFDGRNVKQSSDEFDDSDNHSRQVFINLTDVLKNIYRIKCDGKISRKCHQNKQKIED